MHARRSAPGREAGFSLLELVVVVAILTVVMGAAFSLMTNSQTSFDRNEILAEAHQNADFAVLRVAELVRGAGANPVNTTAVNSQSFISRKEVGSSTDDAGVLRIISDLNCDGLADARVESNGSNYYIVSSEDVTLKFYGSDTTVGGVAVPGHSLCIIDNTAGTNPSQGEPVVLASNILACTFTISNDMHEVTATIQAGPSKPIPETDPRYATFTRTVQVRLRNRN